MKRDTLRFWVPLRVSGYMRRNARRVPIAGSGRMDEVESEGEAARWWESSVRVQSGQVWIVRWGGREDEENSSGLKIVRN